MFSPADLKPGDVILVEGGATTVQGRILDALIRWSTGSPFTHACLATGPGGLIEAVATVREDDAAKYARVGTAFRVAATPEQRAAAVAAARKRLGRPYSTMELLLDAARFDLHWVPRWTRPLRSTTCSGLVAACYMAGGVLITRAKWPAPGDLFDSPLLTPVPPAAP